MAQTFHKFLQLPVELRLMIWRRACLLFPRIVEIYPTNTDTLPHLPHYSLNPSWGITSHSPPNPFSLVSHESRNEFLAYRKTLSEKSVFNPEYFGSTFSAFPFDFDFDMLYVPRSLGVSLIKDSRRSLPGHILECVFGSAWPEASRSLQFLVLDNLVFWEMTSDACNLLPPYGYSSFITKLHGLKEVVFIEYEWSQRDSFSTERLLEFQQLNLSGITESTKFSEQSPEVIHDASWLHFVKTRHPDWEMPILKYLTITDGKIRIWVQRMDDDAVLEEYRKAWPSHWRVGGAQQ